MQSQECDSRWDSAEVVGNKKVPDIDCCMQMSLFSINMDKKSAGFF